MKPLAGFRLGCLAGAVLVLVGGCSSTTADGPTTAVVSVTVSPSVIDPSTVESASPVVSASPSAAGSSPAPSSSDISPEEAADRAAIEAQWAAFWSVYVEIIRTPAEQRSAALDAVAVDPAKQRVLDAASRLEDQGLDYFGTVNLHPYAVDFDTGGNSAVLSDCQDQSGYGSIYVASGEKRTVGVDHNHTQAGFIRGADGIWRVQNVQYIENVPC